jgi:hypothetical protein
MSSTYIMYTMYTDCDCVCPVILTVSMSSVPQHLLALVLKRCWWFTELCCAMKACLRKWRFALLHKGQWRRQLNAKFMHTRQHLHAKRRCCYISLSRCIWFLAHSSALYFFFFYKNLSWWEKCPQNFNHYFTSKYIFY